VLLDETKGTGIMLSQVVGYEPYKGRLQKFSKGSIVSMAEGIISAYALKDIEKFGQLFVRPN
jgi:GTP-binding protein